MLRTVLSPWRPPGDRLQAGSSRIKDAIDQTGIVPWCVGASLTAYDALKGHGISRIQIDLALEQLRREDQADQAELF
ncbi:MULTISPECIES: hypothetical protein [unclassified Synechococcus]|uniref:hypothetical protein n=1 Tax=unclassified Synechococcus TaxID=2626047 RepID=UPI001628D539|nr:MULTISPECIES: hypothetical protein [unclassified Synechococcus]